MQKVEWPNEKMLNVTRRHPMKILLRYLTLIRLVVIEHLPVFCVAKNVLPRHSQTLLVGLLIFTTTLGRVFQYLVKLKVSSFVSIYISWRNSGIQESRTRTFTIIFLGMAKFLKPKCLNIKKMNGIFIQWNRIIEQLK